MANLKDIRRRILSVKSTQKITKAMKLVSAAKFARANHAVTSARPYSQALDSMVSSVLASVTDAVSPLLVTRQEQRALFVLVSTDRGFCGGLNSNLFRFSLVKIRELRQRQVQVDVVAWGKRARLFAEKAGLNVISTIEKATDRPTFARAQALAEGLFKSFSDDGGYDRVYLTYMSFRSALSQQADTVQLLPVQPKADKDAPVVGSLLTEPDPEKLLSSLLSRKLANTVFRALLEASASEHGARMTAMDSATNNAKEVIKKLTIQYNRARQAAITKELIEITSGADALA
jgi:F-type H+-transporting ATPase subunit gamma